MTFYEKSYVELSRSHTDFGVRDRVKKPRAVGYTGVIYKVTYTAKPEDARGGYHLPTGFPAVHLEVAAFPTRDGRHYGASSKNIHCLTVEEAQAIIAKRTEAARKREIGRFA